MLFKHIFHLKHIFRSAFISAWRRPSAFCLLPSLPPRLPPTPDPDPLLSSSSLPSPSPSGSLLLSLSHLRVAGLPGLPWSLLFCVWRSIGRSNKLPSSETPGPFNISLYLPSPSPSGSLLLSLSHLRVAGLPGLPWSLLFCVWRSIGRSNKLPSSETPGPFNISLYLRGSPNLSVRPSVSHCRYHCLYKRPRPGRRFIRGPDCTVTALVLPSPPAQLSRAATVFIFLSRNSLSSVGVYTGTLVGPPCKPQILRCATVTLMSGRTAIISDCSRRSPPVLLLLAHFRDTSVTIAADAPCCSSVARRQCARA
jgi:hypothetical protein